MKSTVKVKENSAPYQAIELSVNCPKAQFKDISAKSIGLLFFIISSDASISAEALATTLLEGESAIATGLKELRNLGFLKLENIRNREGTFTKHTKVTPSGYAFFAQAIAQIGPYNSHFAQLFYNPSIPSGSSLGKFIPRSNEEPRNIISPDGYLAPTRAENGLRKQEESEEEQLHALNKLKRDREEWVAKKKKVQRAQFKARAEKPNKATWTPTDMSFEFADRIENYWNIEPWRVTKTRFRMILADMRKRHNTNGLIECAMMDVFFEQEDISKFQDANFVMMRFFYRFGELYQYVKSRDLALTESELAEKIARERKVAEQARQKLRNQLASYEVKDPVVTENRQKYDYYKQQRELDFSVGIITAEELASSLAALDLEYQPR
jgi:hypothetical protein